MTWNVEIRGGDPCEDVPEIPKGEQPYPLPKGWMWVKGERIFSAGGTALPSGDFFEYIDIDSIDNTRQLVKAPKRIAVEDAPSRARRKLAEGDTLFSLVRPYLRNIAYIDKSLAKCIASTGFYVCHPSKHVDSKYLFWLMTSDYVVNGLNEYMRGDNSPAIKAKDIEGFLFPVAPKYIQQYLVKIIEPILSKLSNSIEDISLTSQEIIQLKKVILSGMFSGKYIK